MCEVFCKYVLRHNMNPENRAPEKYKCTQQRGNRGDYKSESGNLQVWIINVNAYFI